MLFRALSRMLAIQQPRLAPVDGARLNRIGERAWAADRSLVYGTREQLPLRMVVLRDDRDGLTLYSPLALDAGTLEALAGLGKVRHLVVPNRFHTGFVGAVADCFPEASLLLPSWNAGLEQRFPARSKVVVNGEHLGAGLELRRVILRDGLDELVLYHDSSELLAVADLIFNLQHGGTLSRVFYRLNGVWRRPATSRLQRWLLLKNHIELDAFYRWAMDRPFSQISVAHGQLITADAREHFYQLFASYGRS